MEEQAGVFLMPQRIHDDPRYRGIPVEKVRRHFLVERELRNKILESTSLERSAVFASAYSDLFRMVPWHPALREVHSGPDPDVVRAKLKTWGPLIGTRPLSILEIGFGSGELLVALAEMGHSCAGVDVEATRVAALARHSVDGLRLMEGDGTRPEMHGDKFDVVISQQLFEHLHPDDALEHLQAVRKLLHDGGRYFLETPNRHFGPHDVSRFFVDGSAQGFHLREYSIGEMTELIIRSGFSRPSVVLWKTRFMSVSRARQMEWMALRMPRKIRRRFTMGLHNPLFVASS